MDGVQGKQKENNRKELELDETFNNRKCKWMVDMNSTSLHHCVIKVISLNKVKTSITETLKEVSQE